MCLPQWMPQPAQLSSLYPLSLHILFHSCTIFLCASFLQASPTLYPGGTRQFGVRSAVATLQYSSEFEAALDLWKDPTFFFPHRMHRIGLRLLAGCLGGGG